MHNKDRIASYIIQEHQRVTSQEAQRDLLQGQLEEIEKKIMQATELVDLNLKTSQLLKQSSSHARKQSIDIIEHLVTKCLQYIFQNQMTFKIEEKESKKSSQVEFYVTDENGDESYLTRPEESRGGGVVDVVSIGLRVAISELLKNRLGGPLVFDEPAKYVSADYIGNVGLFLKNISTDFERQVIMVTHNEYLSNIGDRIYSVLLKEQSSDVEKIL
ncbi:MAG: ATPase [Tissierellia bacterium]|nr:ATPase [Tissierellia bacterium]